MMTTLLTTIVLSILSRSISSQPISCSPPTSPFYLVTTTYSSCSSNSSLLPNVSATSTFAPAHQPTLLLRTIAPGYFSLPNFTFADGSLHTISDGPFGAQTQLYNSTTPGVGDELGFAAAGERNGTLSLVGGYLLAVGGDTEGWTLCVGNETMGEPVVSSLIALFPFPLPPW
jgi:hypothetical protein